MILRARWGLDVHRKVHVRGGKPYYMEQSTLTCTWFIQHGSLINNVTTETCQSQIDIIAALDHRLGE